MSLPADPTGKGPRIDGLGTAEGDWIQWSLEGLDLLDVGNHTRAVVLAPHPDDEVLGAGGLLQRLAAAGTKIAVVSVTDGEASHPRSPTVSARDLAARRAAELRQALDALGLPLNVTRLKLPDGSVADRVGDLGVCLDLFLAPGVLCLAPWENDGHPDHDATGRAAAAACAVTGAIFLRYLVWTWHWATPGDRRVPWTEVRRLALSSAELTRKQRAIQSFETQVAPLSPGAGDEAILAPGMLAHFHRPYEVFLT